MLAIKCTFKYLGIGIQNMYALEFFAYTKGGMMKVE